jgi:arylsulfatase
MQTIIRPLIPIAVAVTIFASYACTKQESPEPNVIVVITDDQGYGDLGCTGNPHVKTPFLDNFARESIRFKQFYVSPVCAPTRSSLMTGRYSLRTGVRDTYNGGAIMASEEVTIAEMLRDAGYRTGIFGKWHLGDNYPFRPCDQGFDESVIHLSGGMGQPGDFTTFFRRDSSYFDPVLWHNGNQQQYVGYCTDIFTEEALSFIENNSDLPFFCYIAFNAPHAPLQVPEKYYDLYKDIDPSAGFENDNRPFPVMTEQNREDARKVYAMVTNIDENFGKLLKKLDDLKISENTVVVFMTDNGPQQPRYVAGMRGRKGSVFRGGVRVPFFLRYPDMFEGNKDIESTAAHIDVLPTIAEICRVKVPDDRIIDGMSLLPLIKDKPDDKFNDRHLFFYWSRRFPELYNNIALQKGNYKLVANTNYNTSVNSFELFDLKKDEFEQNDILSGNLSVAGEMKSELDNILYELSNSENIINPPRMIIGTEYENPLILNRNDAWGEPGVWTQEEVYGMWRVKITEGTYDIRFKFIEPLTTGGVMHLETNSLVYRTDNTCIPTDVIEMKNVNFHETECDLITQYITGGKRIFPLWVELKKTDL